MTELKKMSDEMKKKRDLTTRLTPLFSKIIFNAKKFKIRKRRHTYLYIYTENIKYCQKYHL